MSLRQFKKEVTVSCCEGETGFVYEGLIDYDLETFNLKDISQTRTIVMMNVGIPEKAFAQGLLPNDGVGLARQEFIINAHIDIHPLALLDYDTLKQKAQIDQTITGVVYPTVWWKYGVAAVKRTRECSLPNIA
jgi:pyruvate, water dikinase